MSCAETVEPIVWVVDSGGLKEPQVQKYLPGGANVPTWQGILAPPGEANTIEPSVCGSDAVLCQITLTITIVVAPISQNSTVYYKVHGSNSIV